MYILLTLSVIILTLRQSTADLLVLKWVDESILLINRVNKIRSWSGCELNHNVYTVCYYMLFTSAVCSIALACHLLCPHVDRYCFMGFQGCAQSERISSSPWAHKTSLTLILEDSNICESWKGHSKGVTTNFTIDQKTIKKRNSTLQTSRIWELLGWNWLVIGHHIKDFEWNVHEPWLTPQTTLTYISTCDLFTVVDIALAERHYSLFYLFS